jgi:hypothetical protein
VRGGGGVAAFSRVVRGECIETLHSLHFSQDLRSDQVSYTELRDQCSLTLRPRSGDLPGMLEVKLRGAASVAGTERMKK